MRWQHEQKLVILSYLLPDPFQKNHRSTLVKAALRIALTRCDILDTPIHHTDQGSQYTADDYLALLKTHGIQVSMSCKSAPYDNAMIESFFSTLRAQLTDLERFPSRRRAQTALFEFVEVFYYRQGLHSSLRYRTPLAYEIDHFSRSLSYPVSIKMGQDHDQAICFSTVGLVFIEKEGEPYLTKYYLALYLAQWLRIQRAN